jgi:hypothetical protein
VILLRAESSSLYRKSIFLSGCPDINIVQPPGPDTKVNAWLAAFQAYRLELLAHWGFVATNRGGDSPPVDITAISGAGPFKVTAPANGFPANSRVRIAGTVPRNPVAGVWAIDIIDANNFTLRNSVGTYAYDHGGTASLYNKSVKRYTEVLINGETHRKRGRFFAQQAGRSKRRAKS